MSDPIVNDLTKELLNFEMPYVSAIFAGVDQTGPHIYTVYNNEVICSDNIAFYAIGVGSRHASSQFMFARHAWNAPFPETLLLTYYAKRKSEAAPGVGKGTNMIMVPGLGGLLVVGDHVITKLDQEYQRLIRMEAKAFARAQGEMKTYVEELNKHAAAAEAAQGGQQAPQKSNGGTPSFNEPEVRNQNRQDQKEKQSNPK
jgi:hypothetical protein